MYPARLDPDDLNSERRAYDGTFVYALAKRAQVTLTEQWAARFAGTGVVVNCMHPGWADTPGVRTQIRGFFEKNRSSFRDDREGADTITWMALSPFDDAAKAGGEQRYVGTRSGLFFFDRQAVRTHMPFAWTAASPAEEARLWRGCCTLFGVDWPLQPLQPPPAAAAAATAATAAGQAAAGPSPRV